MKAPNRFGLSILLLILMGWGSAAFGQSRVAVMNFKNGGVGQYQYLESGIANMLSTVLASSHEIRVVERNQLDKILEELKLGMSGLLDPSTAARVGKIAGAQFVVIGSYLNLGRAMRLDARVVNVETAMVIPGVTAWAKTEIVENLDEAVHDLASQLLTALTGQSVKPLVEGQSGQTGRFEFTFLDDTPYLITIGDKKLRPKQGSRASVSLKHGRYLLRIDHQKGLFNSEPVYQTYIDIPGGYLVRATFRDEKFSVFETTPLGGVGGSIPVGHWRKAGPDPDRPLRSQILISSSTGLCDIYLNAEKKASLALPNIDGRARATIDEVYSGAYQVKVEGDDVWYEGKLTVHAGEVISIETDPGKFKIVRRQSLVQ